MRVSVASIDFDGSLEFSIGNCPVPLVPSRGKRDPNVGFAECAVEFEGLGYRHLGPWEALPWQTIASTREITVRPG